MEKCGTLYRKNSVGEITGEYVNTEKSQQAFNGLIRVCLTLYLHVA